MRSLGTILVVAFLSILPLAHAGPKYEVLYAFTNGPDGGGAWSSVVLDKKGNVYGTTSGGGDYGFGTVFRLKPQPAGPWTEEVLHSFAQDDPDGDEPFDGVIFDDKGNLYGTTITGGAHNKGTAFVLTSVSGAWRLQVIYDFCAQQNCSDGGSPSGGLALDPAGYLYGTAGVVFDLSPGQGGWIESVLYSFCAKPNCSDGWAPYGLLLDAKGNLYGTTGAGGNYPPACPVGEGCGGVFKLRPNPDGSWNFKVLHRFAAFPTDGVAPTGGLALDPSGVLYGVTGQGGTHICNGTTGCGTIYKLSRQPNGHWKETILHNFRQNKNGYLPGSGVVRDSAGNFYGTTGFGGAGNCDCGVVYKLASNPDGTWTYTVLHSFTGDDGFFPAANLTLDDKGNLYGTTVLGGPGLAGVVFKITP